MTLQDIKDALIAKIDELEVTYPLQNTLTDAENTVITDELAAVLDDVNPNHQYPPTSK